MNFKLLVFLKHPSISPIGQSLVLSIAWHVLSYQLHCSKIHLMAYYSAKGFNQKYYRVLVFRINVRTSLFIQDTFSSLHGLIRDRTFIYFSEFYIQKWHWQRKFKSGDEFSTLFPIKVQFLSASRLRRRF